jgi:recombination protein RecA
MFGNPETTTGGNALKFYSSLRLEVRKTETIEVSKDADAIGNRVRVKVVKNKVSPPFRKTELELLFGKGISALGSLLDCAVKNDLINKSGAWYSYKDEKIGQGRDNARLYLEQHSDIAQELEAKLRRTIFPDRFPDTDRKAGKDKPQQAEKAPSADGAVDVEAVASEVAEKPPAFEAAPRGRPRKSNG